MPAHLPYQVTSAVLLTVFCRHELACEMMQRLRAVRPARLYIAADGPREHVPSDMRDCAATRRLVVEAIDWSCDVKLRFRDKNMGVQHGMVDAIDWFFANEEAGIILEDDIMAEPDFFRFCDEMLAKYADRKEVGTISGPSYWMGPAQYSYYASTFTDMWGWATWRDRWQQYDPQMKNWPEFDQSGKLAQMPGASRRFVRYWRRIFDEAKADRFLAWDYQWILTRWSLGSISIFPTVPLVRNKGFGSKATNTKVVKAPRYCREAGTLDFPLKHPPSLTVDPVRERDMWAFRFFISATDDFIYCAKAPGRWMRRLARALRG